MHKYTEEQRSYIKRYAKGRTSKELTDMFNKKFGLDIKVRTMQSYKTNLKVTSGVDCRFKKGQVSHNKGKKMPECLYEKMKATMFKKGDIPSNKKPIGSERIIKDGYTEIKVAEPNKWKAKHRVIWEKVNGKISKGYALVFADGNKQNFGLDNLILVSRAELLIINRQQLIKDDPDLTKTGVLIAKVIDKANKKRVV